MEHELLEGGPSLGDDEEPDRRAPGDEGFLDGTPTGHELLVGAEGFRGWQRRRPGWTAVAGLERRARIRAPTLGPRTERSIRPWTASVRCASERSLTGRPDPPRS